jgi:hypothetical protein
VELDATEKERMREEKKKVRKTIATCPVGRE